MSGGITEEFVEVEKRRTCLVVELKKEASKHEHTARIHDFFASALFYCSLLFGGLAVAAGLIKSVNIPSEVISLFAAMGTGASILSREAKYRAHADWNYAVHDTAQQLVGKLEFELPLPVKDTDVTAVSQEWRRKRAELGVIMTAIRGAPDERGRHKTQRNTSISP